MDDTTRANGYKHGRPEGRDVKPADEIVRKVIEALPAETRLYPDVYAWQVTDALEAATSAPAVDREELIQALIRARIDWHGTVTHEAEISWLADAVIAHLGVRDVRDVQAEALEQAAKAMRSGRDDFYVDVALGGAGFVAEWVDARAQAIREARNER